MALALRTGAFSVLKTAYYLFDEIPHRRNYLRTSMFSLSYGLLRRMDEFYEDPVELYGEKKEVFAWTSKISSLVKRDPREAIDLFKLMLVKGYRPNYVTVLSVLRAVSGLRSKDMSYGVHGLVIKMGFEVEVSVVTSLIGVYGNWDVSVAWKLFLDMSVNDLVMWCAMISMCVKNGEYMRAIELFREMVFKGMEPNVVSIVSILPACAKLGSLLFGKQVHAFVLKKRFFWQNNVQNSLIDMYAKCEDLDYSACIFTRFVNKDLITWKTVIRGCIQNDNPRKAITIFNEMRSACSELDDTILCDVVSAASNAVELNFGKGLHCFSLKSGYAGSIAVGTSLMQMYAKVGLMEPARMLLNQLHPKDIIAWSALISAYAQSGYASESLDAFKQMQLAHEKPNEVTFVSLLQACSSLGAQELGESIHGCVVKSGYINNTFLISTLIDLYCKFGRIKQGRALFDGSLIKDLICWSSMINGYGLNGRGGEALNSFLNMLDSGVMPNDVVFLSVLSSCSHCGLDDEGWYWFYCMQDNYGIKPRLAHYACMVDLLSRQGDIEGALKFVYNMPIEPDKRIWGSLLAGCRSTHGSIEIAELVAERLIGLDPDNTSYYVVLSNLYAEEGRWDDVERVRKLIDEKGIEKMTGYSTI